MSATASLRTAIALAVATLAAALPCAAAAASPLLRPAPAPAPSPAPVAAPISADPAGPVRGTVILIHGGGWIGHDAGAQRHLMQQPGDLFLQRGWRVVSIDYEEGARGLQDVLDTAGSELARRSGDGPLCLYGESSGGHLGLIAAARLPAIDCVIGVGTPTDIVNYQAEAVPNPEPRVKLVALRTARYFGTAPAELAQWDPVTLAPTIRADLLLLREGDDAVVSAAHAQRVQAERPTTQILDLEPGDPADLSTALLHGTVSAAGRGAYASALGAFADRAVAARNAERAATRTGCSRVSRSLAQIGVAGVRRALRCLAAAPRLPRRSAARGWRRTLVTMRGEINAARIWDRLRVTGDGRRALHATATQKATVIVRPGPRSQITLRAR